MFTSLKIAQYTILIILVGIFLQPFKYMICVADVTTLARDNRHSEDDLKLSSHHQTQKSNLLESLALYIPTAFSSRDSRQTEATPPKEECGTNGDHMVLIYVPTEAVDRYSWVIRMTEDKTQQLTPIKVCCPGYGLLRWRGERKCVPVCDKCRNGLCVAPNVCKCYDEYIRNDSDDCVFVCPLGCLNGRCYLDGSCECNPGYKLDETRKFCRPICSKGCGRDPLHNCTAPEVCSCIRGFQLTDGGCRPVCEPECGPGGECQAFGTKPKCVCYQGYHEQDGVCQSDCYQSCANGICYNPNRCICNPGFVYHERTRNCIPQLKN
ncbi:uncharacterized protein LOC142224172 [Haematobia irritans]|uniref:uncharacterized protein LOC142224172 n=1 Tax=Haematobia irritans TaxID=7368 RepID=UPI003F500B80